MPSFPSGWSRTTCDHIAQRSGILGSNGAMSAGDGRTTEPRIRISQRGGGNARCSDSRAPAPRRSSSRPMLPSTTPSTSNVISLQPKRTACYALRRWTRGGPQPQLPNNCRGADASRSTCGDVTKPPPLVLGPGHLGAIVSVVTAKPREADYYRNRLAHFTSLSHLTVEVTHQS